MSDVGLHSQGQRRKWRHSQIKSAFLSTTDIHRGKRDVSFVHAITGKHPMMLPPHRHSVRVARYRNSTSLGTTNEMFPKEPNNARVEIAVKGCPIEARRHVGTNTRYCSRELR
jgi:hypothetical protein